MNATDANCFYASCRAFAGYLLTYKVCIQADGAVLLSTGSVWDSEWTGGFTADHGLSEGQMNRLRKLARDPNRILKIVATR